MTIRIIVGIILFLLSTFWAYRDLRRPLLFLIALFPFNDKEYFNLGAWNISPSRVALAGILVGAGLRLLVSWGRERATVSLKIREFFRDPVLLLLLVLWGVRLVSITNSLNLGASLALLGFFSAVVGLYVVLKWCRQRYGDKFLLSLFRFHVGIVALSGLWSLVQYVTYKMVGINLPGAVWPTEYQPLRVGSLFWDINHYSAYLTTVLPILGLLAVERQVTAGFKSAAWLWVFFAYELLILVMTLSRSGWGAVGLAFCLALVFLLTRRETRRVGAFLFKILLGILLFAILGSIFWRLPILERLTTFVDIYNNDSIKSHLSVLRGVWLLFKKSPLIGVGYGSFSEHFGLTAEASYFFSKDPVDYVRIPAHSVWGEVLSETGICGILIYLSLVVVILRPILRRFVQQGKYSLLLLGAFCSIVGLLFSGIFYSYNLIFFWFFIFLAYQLASTGEVVGDRR